MQNPSHSKPDPSPTLPIEVRVVIFSLRNSRLQTLLVSDGVEDAPGWVIPGLPYVKEISLENIAHQCLSSYTGQHEIYLEQLYTYGDPARNDGSSVVSVVYFSLVPADAFLVSSNNQVQSAWFPLDGLPQVIMDHREILEYALRRLRYKLEYTAVGFELLPEIFSLSELQQTYEIILGETLDKRNFRRRILDANIIEPTPHQRTGEGRPARLYHYRPDAVAEAKARRLFP